MPSLVSIRNEGLGLLFMISALRAVVELLLCCFVAQSVLGLLCGQSRAKNPIYQLFALINRPWRKGLGFLLKKPEDSAWTGMVGLIILLMFWIGFAYLKNNL